MERKESVRIISARRAIRKEARQYEKAGSIDADEMRAEYDFSNGVRNPYAAKFKKGSNVVLIEPEIFKAFPSEEAVNSALRIRLKAGAEAVKSKSQKQAKAS